MLIMKKEIIHLSLARRKTRAIELYASNSPFKPKKVESKLLYKRKAKHSKRDFSLD